MIEGYIKNIIRVAKAVRCRNKIILANLSWPSVKGCVNLNWWKQNGEVQNVGDWLSLIVVDHMKAQHNIHTDTAAKGTKHLYAIGSIIDGGYQDATIWGSGLHRGRRRYWWRHLRKLDIRCVRGPETRSVLMDHGYACPEIYGDPAILMPLIYQPERVEKVYDYRVVPHMIFGTGYPNALSPATNDWRAFIDEIVRSKLVISSSLHGIILAEAYGIPAILLHNNNLSLFKYKDYYSSTGRYTFPIAQSVEEALSMTPAEIPDFTNMQKNLIDVFPVDLWAEKTEKRN